MLKIVASAYLSMLPLAKQILDSNNAERIKQDGSLFYFEINPNYYMSVKDSGCWHALFTLD